MPPSILRAWIMVDNSRRSFCKAISGAAGISLVTSFAGCLGGDGSESRSAITSAEDPITAGGSQSGDTVFQSLQGILSVLESESEYDLTVQETPSGGTNIRFYDQGQIDMGATSTLDLATAHEGTHKFEEEPVDKVPLQGFRCAILQTAAYAREATDIHHWDDLPGEDMWPMSPGSSVRFASEIVLKELGMWDEMEIYNVDHSDAANALEEERFDAICIDMLGGVGLGGGYVEQVDARTDIRALEMDEERQEVIDEIPGIPFELVDVYGWDQDVGLEQIPTWGIDLQIVFGHHMSEDVVYDITNLVIENTETVQESQVGFPGDAESMAASIDENFPVHPGAIKAFDEHGIDTSNWEAGELSIE